MQTLGRGGGGGAPGSGASRGGERAHGSGRGPGERAQLQMPLRGGGRNRPFWEKYKVYCELWRTPVKGRGLAVILSNFYIPELAFLL